MRKLYRRTYGCHLTRENPGRLIAVDGCVASQEGAAIGGTFAGVRITEARGHSLRGELV